MSKKSAPADCAQNARDQVCRQECKPTVRGKHGPIAWEQGRGDCLKRGASRQCKKRATDFAESAQADCAESMPLTLRKARQPIVREKCASRQCGKACTGTD